jgi:AP-3 complex subunit delta-1
MFEKTLSDIVKGIRASKRDTALYISQCIAEIKTEISSPDMFVKSNALQKLTFLQMMGYGMSYASFATIEVMSSPRFAHKRIGYLAAIQGFTQDTDVILLTTNSLKKELRRANGGGMRGVYEAGLAINCVANIVTAELAQDLLPELTNLTSHPQPYLRKKAILCLFRLFVKYPQGLRLTFAKIQQCLSDSDPAVASCSVNVITELSDKNPRNYLHLAPAFFDLLTSSSNNWMLIKVVKLLGSLVPEEPRLARKLLEPLSQIVRSTPAKSLMYEAVHAITLCLPYCRKNDGSMPAIVPEIVDLCAKTLRDYVEQKDQNLKYLGLVGFSSLMQSHPKVLSAPTYRPLILACLSDEDVTIRTRALGLLPGMASRKNLMELVKQLLQHVEYASGSYKLDLVAKIVEMCCSEKYAMLQNFSWYLDTLFQLGHIRGLETHAVMLRTQVSDIALRVLPVRSYAVKRSLEILLEGENIKNNVKGDNGRGKHMMPDILPALAWIVGEYSDLFPEAISIDKDVVYIYNNDSEGPYHSLIQAITAPASSMKLPASTQKVYVQAALKVFAAATGNEQVSDAELEACCMTLTSNLQVFMQSTDVEVQERSFTLYALMQSLELTTTIPRDAPPALLNINQDEDDSSDEEAEGNLLEMQGSILPTLKPSSSNKAKKKSMVPDGLASRCRSSSQTLDFLLKQSPMKPTSAKLQRKKHNAPIGIDIDIHAPVDLSIFASLIEEEKAHRAKGRSSMEAITFTQQRPKLDTNSFADTQNANDASTSTPLHGSLLSDPNFQMYGGDQKPQIVPSNNGAARPPSSSDPFYLNSSPAILDSEQTPNLPSRFGTIELGDVDSDDDVAEEKQKRRKQKKKKKQKSGQAQGISSDFGLGQGFGNVTVYGSDDDDDNEAKERLLATRVPGQRTPGKEFDSLARVDLTMPLREDEVMPERRHRVVPERPVGSLQPFSDQPKILDHEKPMKAKKKKKESKKSKKKSKENVVTVNDDIGDCFNLGVTSSVPQTVPTQPLNTGMEAANMSSPGMVMQESNAISNAFDDLLGLTDSPPVVSLPTPAPSVFDSNTSALANSEPPSLAGGKEPWIRASIKTSHARGSPVVDWTKVHLSFRVYLSPSGSTLLIFRVENHMETSMLKGLVLRLRDHADISLGDVPPRVSIESAKSGPFSVNTPELKGSLVTPECTVPLKFSLPVSTNFNPVKGLRLEDVAQQLSSAQWSSNTAKIELTGAAKLEIIKPILCKFLSMEEVEPQSSGPLSGTFAGQSSDGAQIRVLVKVKQSSVKIDVKCTNPVLGKALCSDLKRLVL